MSTKHLPLAVSLTLSALLAAPAFAAGRHLHLVFVERATTDATTHVGKGDDNAGDILTFSNPVFDQKDQNQVGTDQGYCIRVVPGKAYECQWTLTTPQGRLMVEGPFFDASDSTMTVIGGTGAYRGARGEMKLHARDAKGSAYDFTYSIDIP
jgi:hypothetical protein